MCGGDLINMSCRLCGAEVRINPTSGNAMWIKNGRVIASPEDEKKQFLKMVYTYNISQKDFEAGASRYNIPREQWPDKYK